MTNPIRAVIAALTIILTAVTMTALLAPGHKPGAFVVHRPHSVTVGHSYPISLDGLNQAASVELARRAPPAPVPRPTSAPPTVTHAAPAPRTSINWDAIARCETGGNWAHLGRAPDGTTYDGGLGILHAAWIDFGGLQFAPRGDLASRPDQIIVAERIYARYGLSGWGCRAVG